MHGKIKETGERDIMDGCKEGMRMTDTWDTAKENEEREQGRGKGRREEVEGKVAETRIHITICIYRRHRRGYFRRSIRCMRQILSTSNRSL